MINLNFEVYIEEYLYFILQMILGYLQRSKV